MTDVRSNVVAEAQWGVANHAHFTYSEGPDRMSSIGKPKNTLPVTCDCSAFATLCYYWASAPDPNGLGYDHEGYTGTLLSHDEHITLLKKNAQGINVTEVIPGDLVIYGGGTGEHVAVVIEAYGQDVLTISMGQQGDPSYVWANPPKTLPSRGYPVDGRQPQTFLRCDTTQVAPKPTPKPTPAPKPTPKPVPKPTPKPVAPKPAPKKKQA